MSNKDGKTKKTLHPIFTFDSLETGDQEMPSISTLLRRKKLRTRRENATLSKLEINVKTTHAPSRLPTPPAPPWVELPAEPKVNLPEAEVGQVKTQVRKGSDLRRSRRNKQALRHWTPEILRESEDPIAHALLEMQAWGVHQAIFLGISKNQSKVTFKSKAMIRADERSRTWLGLTWDPLTAVRHWKLLYRHGFAELSPPSKSPDEETRWLRTAFGVQPTESLILIRVGTTSACRGILAVLIPSARESQFMARCPHWIAALDLAPQKSKKAA